MHFLPKECQDLYKEEQSNSFDKFRKAKDEALQFKSFYEILKKKTEIQRDKPEEHLEINFPLLNEIYTKMENEISSAGCEVQRGFLEYFDCLMERRNRLEQKVRAL